MGLTYLVYGSSRGLGLTLATELSSDPSNTVIGTTRSTSAELSTLAAQRTNFHSVTLDITEAPETLDTLPEAVKQYSDSIDVLIVNGAINKNTIRPATEVPANVWLDHYKVNALAPTLLVSKLLPLLKAGSAKQIVFISSVAGSISGFLPFTSSAYGQSKAALNFVTKLLDNELKPDGITTISLHPGTVRTVMYDDVKAAFKKDDPILEYVEKEFITVAESVTGILKVTGKLELTDSGRFFSYDGTETSF